MRVDFIGYFPIEYDLDNDGFFYEGEFYPIGDFEYSRDPKFDGIAGTSYFSADAIKFDFQNDRIKFFKLTW